MAQPSAGSPAAPSLATEDPYIRVTLEIWGLIKAKCQLPAQRNFDIAILGVPPDDVRFTADQKDFLAQKITSSASQILRTEPQAKAAVSIRDVAEMIAIMGTGESRAKVDEMIKKAENYNVGVQVRGGRVTQRGYRIALTALGRNGVDCSEQTSAVDLPPDAFPENIIGVAELLSRAAQHVLERNLGSRELVVPLHARMTDGTAAPDIWNESLARSFTRSVPMARARLPTRSLEVNDLRAEASHDAPKPDKWRTEIVLDNSARIGTRLEVEVRPPQGTGQEGTAFDGLIDPESLPPLPLRNIAAAVAPAQAPQAPVIVATAPPPEAVAPPSIVQPPAVALAPAVAPQLAPAVAPQLAPAGVQPPAADAPAVSPAANVPASVTKAAPEAPPPSPAAVVQIAPKPEPVKPEPATPEIAKLETTRTVPDLVEPALQPLPLTQTPQRFQVALDAQQRRQDFAFSLPRSTVVEVDLSELGSAEAPVVGVLQGSARLMAPASIASRTRPNLKRWRLPAGQYSLWFELKGQAPLLFVARTRAALDSLTPEPQGQLVRVAGDWVVGVREQANGERVCYAFTPAIATEPRNWRLLSPFLLFQITPQADAVQHRFDGVEEWANPANVIASVMRANRWERLKIQPDEGVLRSLEKCRTQGGFCLSEGTLLGLTTGTKLSLTGVTKAGAQGLIDYSLKGYQAAMYSMGALCNRKSFANRLVVR